VDPEGETLQGRVLVHIMMRFDLEGLTNTLKLSEGAPEWGPCVVRGPVDGRFLLWWVIDNIVWTDSWLSIAGAGCGLTGVGAGEEQARKVVTGEASRCGEDK
jgi:hypothetical protein